MNYIDLFNYLKQINHPALSSLMKGVSENDITELQHEYSIKLPEDLKLLFQLHDGMSSLEKNIGELSIFPNGIFISLREALNVFKLNKIHSYWQHSYFPLFSSGSGDYILMQLEGDDCGRYYLYSPSNVDFDSIISIYDNQQSFVKSVVTCYENMAYKIEDCSLEIDFTLEAYTCKELNPFSDYWKI